MGLCGFNRMRREQAVKLKEIKEPTEDEIRQQAKLLGIKSWHVKKIEKLLKEIKEANDGQKD